MALFVSIVVAYLLPPESLLFDPPWLRYLVAAALAFAPVFFANLVFSYSFRDTRTADMAFASNLLGAMVGGALEYLALVTGYQSLLLIVAGLYALAWLFATRVRAGRRPRTGLDEHTPRACAGPGPGIAPNLPARRLSSNSSTGGSARGCYPPPVLGSKQRWRVGSSEFRRAAAGWRRMLPSGTQDIAPVPPERRAQTVRRIFSFFRPYRLAVLAVLATIVVTSLLGLVNPFLLKQLIDVAIPQQNFALLTLYVALMIFVPIVSGLIGVGQSYLNNVVGQRVMQDLRNALYTHLQKMPLRFFTETRTGEIQSRLSNDVGGIQASSPTRRAARSPTS